MIDGLKRMGGNEFRHRASWGSGKRGAASRRLRLSLLRPRVEPLEGRALMSHAGSPDGSFGVAGIVSTPFGATGSESNEVIGEAIQKDGKIVVVGQVSSTTDLGIPTATTTLFAVARLNPNGTVDTSFGNHGIVRLFPTQGDYTGFSQAAASDVKIQTDGKLVIGGEGGPGEVQVVRLNPNGSFDASFGSGGVASFSFQLPAGTSATRTQAEVGQIALQPDGKLVVSGIAHDSPSGSLVNQGDLAVARLTTAGTLDPTFHGTGQAVFPLAPRPDGIPQPLGPTGLAVQADGRLVVSVGGQAVVNNMYVHEPVVVRLTADGSLDPSFGTSGQVEIAASLVVPSGHDFLGSALALQNDGKVVVVGTVDGRTAAVRLTTQGSLDPSFGGHGATTVGAPLAGNEFPELSVLVLPNGQLLVGSDIQANAALYRINPDGSVDRRFGAGGTAVLRSKYLTFTPSSLAVQPDGKIVATVANGDVFRLLASGATGDYDNDGRSDPAVYLPSLGLFAYRPSAGGPDVLVRFGYIGTGATIPTPGDYDGDGRSDLAVYLPSQGAFAYRPSLGGPDVIVPFGQPGNGQSIPAPGDYSGSGRTELAVYLPSMGAFAYRPTYSTDVIVRFGIAGPGQTLPAPGDYDGDGKTDLAAYLPAMGAFAIRPSAGGPDRIIPFGLPGNGRSIPVPGDYDGSGKTELAVYLPELGLLAYRPASGAHDVTIRFGAAGTGNSLPAPGDYTGSGKTEAAVYLPSLGALAYRPANGGPDVVQTFGIPGTGQTIPFTEIPATEDGSATVSASSFDLFPDAPSMRTRKGGRSSLAVILT